MLIIAILLQIVALFIGTLLKTAVPMWIGTALVFLAFVFGLRGRTGVWLILSTIITGIFIATGVYTVYYIIPSPEIKNISDSILNLTSGLTKGNVLLEYLFLCVPFIVAMFLILAVLYPIVRIKVHRVNESAYCQQTGTDYDKIYGIGGDAKGLQGEYDLARVLEKAQKSQEGLIEKLYYSLIIPSDKKPQEIDALVVTKYGIFTVEEKNREQNWYILNANEEPMFVGDDGKPIVQAEKIGNPLWQNLGHVHALQFDLAKLDQRFEKFAKGIVAFGPATKGFTVATKGSQIVCRNIDLPEELAKEKEKCLNPLTDADITKITAFFDDCAQSEELKQTHEFYIKQHQLEDAQKARL